MLRKSIMAVVIATLGIPFALSDANVSLAVAATVPGCVKTDAIIGGKHRAPTPALIPARQKSAVCRAQAISAGRMIYDSPAVRLELRQLNDQLSRQYRDEFGWTTSPAAK
jgi:hypothetical protein